jgi:hypothetical protein
MVWSATTAQPVLLIRACHEDATEDIPPDGGKTGLRPSAIVSVDLHPFLPVLSVALGSGEVLFYAPQCSHTWGVSTLVALEPKKILDLTVSDSDDEMKT